MTKEIGLFYKLSVIVSLNYFDGDLEWNEKIEELSLGELDTETSLYMNIGIPQHDLKEENKIYIVLDDRNKIQDARSLLKDELESHFRYKVANSSMYYEGLKRKEFKRCD